MYYCSGNVYHSSGVPSAVQSLVSTFQQMGCTVGQDLIHITILKREIMHNQHFEETLSFTFSNLQAIFKMLKISYDFFFSLRIWHIFHSFVPKAVLNQVKSSRWRLKVSPCPYCISLHFYVFLPHRFLPPSPVFYMSICSFVFSSSTIIDYPFMYLFNYLILFSLFLVFSLFCNQKGIWEINDMVVIFSTFS